MFTTSFLTNTKSIAYFSDAATDETTSHKIPINMFIRVMGASTIVINIMKVQTYDSMTIRARMAIDIP